MIILAKYWRESAIVVLSILLGLTCFYSYTTIETYKQEIASVTKTKQKVQIVEKIVETQKDGTTKTVDRIITKDKEEQKEETILTEAEVRTRLALYSISAHVDLTTLDVETLDIKVGARIFSSPAWLEAGFDFEDKDVTIGVRYEF